MYDKWHAEYIINSQMDKDYIKDSLKIIKIVPKDGLLKMSLKQISLKLKISEERVLEVIEKMKLHKNPLLKVENEVFVFDYPLKDVEYVRHLRNAMSNSGLTEDDF